MNYITGSFSPAVSKSTVKMPVDQSGAPLVVDEDQIKVSDIPRSSVVTHLGVNSEGEKNGMKTSLSSCCFSCWFSSQNYNEEI